MRNVLAEYLNGKRVLSVSIREHNWRGIGIEGGYELSSQALCRFTGENGMFISVRDHEHRFGLPSPCNAEAALSSELIGKTIIDVSVRAHTNDVRLDFSHGSFEILADSIGYELCQLNGPDNLIVVIRPGE